MQSWTERVVETLVVLKDRGWSFEVAWARAIEEHPPGRLAGGANVRSLFELDEPPLVEFLREACSDAWHGRNAILQHLTLTLDRDAAGDRHETATYVVVR